MPAIHHFTGLPAPSGPAPLRRARPQVLNHSLYTDTGKLLRGCTMDIRKQASPPCTQQAVWDGYRALGLNVVRLGVKTDADGAGRPVSEQLPFLDAAINCAWNARMYVMILVSIDPGGYNLAQLTEFWTGVSPRYKDLPHVFYEITNEPVSGSGHWGATGHWTPAKLTELRGVFDIMRAGAPDTHIMMFSTPNIYPNAASWLTVPAQFSAAAATPVDWSNVSISFHHYPGTYASGDPDGFGCLKALQDAGYNLFMSECNDFIGSAASSDPRNSQQVWAWLSTGHDGVSAPVAWCNLDGKAGNVNTQIVPKIIPYLQEQGCPLVVE